MANSSIRDTSVAPLRCSQTLGPAPRYPFACAEGTGVLRHPRYQPSALKGVGKLPHCASTQASLWVTTTPSSSRAYTSSRPVDLPFESICEHIHLGRFIHLFPDPDPATTEPYIYRVQQNYGDAETPIPIERRDLGIYVCLTRHSKRAQDSFKCRHPACDQTAEGKGDLVYNK